MLGDGIEVESELSLYALNGLDQVVSGTIDLVKSREDRTLLIDLKSESDGVLSDYVG